MPDWMSICSTVLAAFMASLVEFVEALTIVLAVALVRGWRSALIGVGAALVLLFAMVICLGPSLALISLRLVQTIVGTLLLLFGLRWLRKAALRAAGVIALHDEAAAFASEAEKMRSCGDSHGAAIDKIALAASFKIVMLEGIEVVFIVIAIGAGGPLLGAAAAGALAALLVVVALGLLLHRPLAKVPENTLKFGVGVLLAAFGTFWVAEGLGLPSALADGTVLALIVLFLVTACLIVPICRARYRRAPRYKSKPQSSRPSQGVIASALLRLGRLFVDDAWLALGILAWVFGARLSAQYQFLPESLRYGLFAAGLAMLMAFSALRHAGRPRSP